MIGIIMNDITYFPIIEKIKEKYPACNIYICRKETEESIKLLIEKNCQIIITTNKNLLLKRKKYPDISFLTLTNPNHNNIYLLENNDLLNYINQGKEKEIRKLLVELTIPKDKVIYIRNPKYLFIKHIIKEYYNNEVEDSISNLINEIILLKKKINFNQKGEVLYLN